MTVTGTGTWRPGCHVLPGCPRPGPVQAGCDRSDVKLQRLSPVHLHIATVTAAAARPGTGQRTGRRTGWRRRLRTMRHLACGGGCVTARAGETGASHEVVGARSLYEISRGRRGRSLDEVPRGQLAGAGCSMRYRGRSLGEVPRGRPSAWRVLVAGSRPTRAGTRAASVPLAALAGWRRGGAAGAGRLVAEPGGDGGRVGWRVGGQQDRGAGRLAEVEVPAELAEHRLVLTDVGAPVGTAVGGRIEAGGAEEVVFDELQVGVTGQDLVVDVAAPGVRRDDQAGHAQAVTVLVDGGRPHVIVEATPVVPGQEDRGGVPVGALHGRVDDGRHVGLALMHAGGRVLAVRT